MLGTYRDAEVDGHHPLAALVADLCRLSVVDRCRWSAYPSLAQALVLMKPG